MSVVHNTQRPDSTIRKKSNQICYHFIRESVAMNESLVTHIETNENPADLATKILTSQPKREYLASKLIHDVYDDHGFPYDHKRWYVVLGFQGFPATMAKLT